MAMIRQENLKSLEKAYGSQRALADALDSTPGYINQLLTNRRTLGEKAARRFEQLLKKPLGWMDQDHLSINATLPGLQGDVAIESNVIPGPAVHGKVPLISWVQAGHASEVVDLLHPGEGFEWIDTTCQIKRHTYALRVRGDSMSPDFPDGSVIIVEPEFDPLPGDYVIAKNGDDEATFKQLIKDGADYYLKPLNERYPIKHLGDYHVIGVVRQLVRQFR